MSHLIHCNAEHTDTQHKGLVCDTQNNNALHYTECLYAKCHILFNVMLSMLNIVMPSAVMLNVIMPSVMAYR